MSAIPMTQGSRLIRPARSVRAARPGMPHVELGHEPALSRDGDQPRHDRRGVSLRWLSGIILTGLFGATLIGSAIYISLDGEMTFAERGELAVTPTQRGDHGGRPVAAPRRQAVRGQRRRIGQAGLPHADDHQGRRPRGHQDQALRARRHQPGARLAGFRGRHSAVQPHEALRRRQHRDREDRARNSSSPTATPKCRCSAGRSPAMTGRPSPAPTLTAEQAAAQVAEEQKALRDVGQRAPLALASQRMLTMALTAPRHAARPRRARRRRRASAFSTMQVTFVPENVTNRPKTPAAAREAAPPQDERMVTVKRGESFEQTLQGRTACRQPKSKSLSSALAARLKEAPGSGGPAPEAAVRPGRQGRAPCCCAP